jgi:hypothetical protein
VEQRRQDAVHDRDRRGLVGDDGGQVARLPEHELVEHRDAADRLDGVV